MEGLKKKMQNKDIHVLSWESFPLDFLSHDLLHPVDDYGIPYIHWCLVEQSRKLQKPTQKVKLNPQSSGQRTNPQRQRPGHNVQHVCTHVGVLIKVGDFRKARKPFPSVLHHHSLNVFGVAINTRQMT